MKTICEFFFVLSSLALVSYFIDYSRISSERSSCLCDLLHSKGDSRYVTDLEGEEEQSRTQEILYNLTGEAPEKLLMFCSFFLVSDRPVYVMALIGPQRLDNGP
mmetsp:Transcript_35371/g.85606  ORF Transcript_35371/g.85606 Transcript_35371/m.85606 type:complete len:104 (-) Transcript_35371:2311-2622(-)